MKIHGVVRALSILALLGLIPLVAGCDVSTFAASQQIQDTLQKAFNTLPDALQTEDLAPFEQYVATPQQGADPKGLAELHKWIDNFRQAGSLPDADVLYELRTLDVSNIQVQGNTATAHVRAELSKVGAGSEADVAITVEQNLALMKVGDSWLIIGADPAQVTNEAQPVK